MLNYSVHASSELSQLAERVRNPEDRQGIETVADALLEAIKFELPDRGELVYGIGSTPEGLEVTRLPYPVIALEFPYSEHEEFEMHKQTNVFHANKRIILATEIFLNGEDAALPVAGQMPTHIFVDVLVQQAGEKGWMLQPISGLIKIGEKSAPPNHNYLQNDPFESQRIRSGATFSFMAVPRIPSVAQMIISQGRERFEQIASNDLGAEMCILGEFLTVLTCTNVTTEVLSPSEKLNKARIKAGKEPFHNARILVIAGRLAGSDASGWTLSEEGYKVKEHLRRGHIRRLADGRRIWVNHTIVAAGSTAGKAPENYKIKRGS